MLLLLAILLAFLAQQLVTPYPYDFLGACALLTALGALLAARGRDTTNRYALAALAALIVLVTVAWKFIPPPLAAGVFIVLACMLFVWQTRNTSATNLAASRTAGVEALADARKSAKASTPRADSQRALHIAIIAVVMLVSAVLCLYDNAHIQPGVHGDEAESGLEARNLNAGRYDTLIGVGWYDQPLPSFLAQAVGLKLFGDNVSGLRTTSAVISLLTLPLVYLLARRMFNARVALIAFALMAVAHWFIAYARLGINYNQTPLLELVAVLAFWEGWQTRRWPWFALSGLAVGAGLYLYFASRVVPILLGAFAGYVWFYNKSQTSTLKVKRLTFNLQP
ncbi:MAG: glycosyltransferase family 39 protein, partial [Chloroflexota bacterium]